MADLEKEIERCENSIRSVYDRLDACENENIKAGADLYAGDGGYSIGTQKKYEEFAKARNYSMGKTRIKELLDEATVYALHETKDAVDFLDNPVSKQQRERQLEIFAEAIIRECADIATIHQQNHAHDSIGRYVLDHFGVAEREE